MKHATTCEPSRYIAYYLGTSWSYLVPSNNTTNKTFVCAR